MSSTDGFAGVLIGLLAANIAYLFITVVFAMVLDVAVVDSVADPFGDVLSTVVTTWVTIGAIIGVADVLAVLGFISSVVDGGSF